MAGPYKWINCGRPSLSSGSCRGASNSARLLLCNARAECPSRSTLARRRGAQTADKGHGARISCRSDRKTLRDRRHNSRTSVPTAQSAEAMSRCASIAMLQLIVDRRGNGILPVDQVGKSDPMLARNERPHAVATTSNGQLIPDSFPACRATATMMDGHLQPLCSPAVDGSSPSAG
jgi:hypothetical protein